MERQNRYLLLNIIRMVLESSVKLGDSLYYAEPIACIYLVLESSRRLGKIHFIYHEKSIRIVYMVIKSSGKLGNSAVLRNDCVR